MVRPAAVQVAAGPYAYLARAGTGEVLMVPPELGLTAPALRSRPT